MEVSDLLEYMKANGLSLSVAPVRYNGKITGMKAVVSREGVFKDVEMLIEDAEKDLINAVFSDRMVRGKPTSSKGGGRFEIGNLGRALKEAEEKNK